VTPESVNRLRLIGLPVFEWVDELADLIHVDPKRLRVLRQIPERFYKRYQIPKKSGGYRDIAQPSAELKAVQAWILRNILDKLRPSDFATAYVAGKHLSDNVSPHAGNRYFISLDIEEFFPSVNRWRVKNIFELAGYPPKTAEMLTSLCKYFDGLPQGGVTSPSLSNLVALRLDRRLAGLCARSNIVFTRYADDMTFSSNNRVVLSKALRCIILIIESERFAVNHSKTRVLGPRTQCRITGLVKDASEPRFGIGRKKKTKMRGLMYNALAKNTFYSQYSSVESFEGWLSFLKGVDQKSFSQMSGYWRRLQEKYKR